MAQMKRQYPPSVSDLSYSESLDIMKMVHEHYRMDIEQIWKRGIVYLTISSALVALISSNNFKLGGPRILFIGFGLSISLIWLINSILSHRWISVWRCHLTRIDANINPYRSFSDGEAKASRVLSLLSRPQFYAVILPAMFVVIWLSLGVADYVGLRVDPPSSGMDVSGAGRVAVRTLAHKPVS